MAKVYVRFWSWEKNFRINAESQKVLRMYLSVKNRTNTELLVQCRRQVTLSMYPVVRLYTRHNSWIGVFMNQQQIGFLITQWNAVFPNRLFCCNKWERATANWMGIRYTADAFLLTHFTTVFKQTFFWLRLLFICRNNEAWAMVYKYHGVKITI